MYLLYIVLILANTDNRVERRLSTGEAIRVRASGRDW